MFVSTAHIQINRSMTTAEREQLNEILDTMAKATGFHAIYLTHASEGESLALAVFDSEDDFRKASDHVASAVQALAESLTAGMPKWEGGEINSQYVNPDTMPGFLSIRRARIKDPKSLEERQAIGKAMATGVSKVPEGRHAFYEVWPSDTELTHLGIYDNRESRTKFMEQLMSALQENPPNLGEVVGEIRESVGDIAAYRIK
jgi:hypothetical protein